MARSSTLLAGLALVGCGSSVPKPAAKPDAPPAQSRQDSEQSLYEQIRAGHFKIDASLASVEAALKDTKALAPEAGGEAEIALLQVATSLDEAGASLGDANDEPPSMEEFQKDFAAQDEKRLASIASAIEGLDHLREAAGILDDLSANVPPERKAALDRVSNETQDAIEGVSEGILALGGKVPPEEETASPVEGREKP